MSIVRRVTKNHGTVYDVRLRDSTGRVYNRTFHTRKEALRFEAAEKTDRARGSWIDPRRSSDRLKDVATEWLGSNPGKKGSSLARDTGIVDNHIVPAIGKSPVGQVTPADVQRLVNEWSMQLGPRTVRRQYAVLTAIMTFAVDTDRLVRTPCRRIRLPDIDPVAHVIITPEQLAKLAQAVGPDTSTMVFLGAVLGLRWGECAGLRVGGIDFLARTVTIDTQLTRGLKGQMVTGGPKWNSNRTLAVPDEMIDLLAAHLRRLQLTAGDPDAFIFSAPDGRALHYSNWRRRVWMPACQIVGLAGFQFKMLRTANATAMVALAVDIKTAQSRAGHRRASTTLDFYAQPTKRADRAAADALGSYFFHETDEPAEIASGDIEGLPPTHSAR
jgi:integrase